MTVRFTDNEEELANYSLMNHYFLINKQHLSDTDQKNTKASIHTDSHPSTTQQKANNKCSFNDSVPLGDHEVTVKYGTQVVDDDSFPSYFEHQSHFYSQNVYSESIKVERYNCTNSVEMEKKKISISSPYNHQNITNSLSFTGSMWKRIFSFISWIYRNSF
jgi:hypothetical protein